MSDEPDAPEMAEPVEARLADAEPERSHAGLWHEVMGTTDDADLIRADQEFLNSVVKPSDIKYLTKKPRLAVDGVDGALTVKVRQFYLHNRYAQEILGRSAHVNDFSGVPNADTEELHRHALTRSSAAARVY